jgi:outer membrane protein assembly factor BamA
MRYARLAFGATVAATIVIGCAGSNVTKVAAVDFDGASGVPVKRLEAAIANKQGEEFSPGALRSDSSAILSVCHDFGYFRASLARVVSVDTGRRVARISFHLREGPRASVDSLIVTGMARLGREEGGWLLDSSRVVPGDAYVKDSLIREKKRILQRAQDIGFPYTADSGAPRVRVKDSLHVVAELPLGFDGRYRFGGLIIEKDAESEKQCLAQAAIDQEIAWHEGDWYSYRKCRETEANLAELKVFELARVAPPTMSATRDARSDSIPMTLHLRLRPALDGSADIFADNEANLLNLGGIVTLLDRNLFCAAQRLTANVSFQVQGFTLTQNKLIANIAFDQPRLRLGSRAGAHDNSLKASVGFLHQTFPFTLSSYNIDLLLIHREATYTYLNPELSFIFQQASIAGLSAADSEKAATLGSPTRPKQPSLLALVTLKRDNTNDLFNPSSGSFGSFSPEVNLLGTPFYIRFEALGKWYAPFGERTVLALRVHGGLAQRLGRDQADILYSRKFFSGGSNSVRGWGAYGLGNVPIISSTLPHGAAGGYSLFEGNVEIRHHLFPEADSWLATVVTNRLSLGAFIDAGNVWTEREKLAWISEMPRQTAVAAGIGFRYDTPIGPIRLDLGWRLYDPEIQQMNLQQGPAIQIGVGNAF